MDIALRAVFLYVFVVLLLRVMGRHDVRTIVFSSSATVYGTADTVPLAEGAPLAAVNPYARTKLMIEDILRASGAQDVLTIQRFAHLIGGCRMGTDPAESVVNRDHQTWAVPNLLVADGSVCPTQGSANPALTIMALSSRLAARLASGAVDLTGGRTGPST